MFEGGSIVVKGEEKCYVYGREVVMWNWEENRTSQKCVKMEALWCKTKRKCVIVLWKEGYVMRNWNEKCTGCFSR